ncbi:MAG: CRISPR-associated protein Csx11 [Promethearchaeota archaeon]
MNDMLEVLEKNRDLILIAEIGALLHDIGKCSNEFIKSSSSDFHSSCHFKHGGDILNERYLSSDFINLIQSLEICHEESAKISIADFICHHHGSMEEPPNLLKLIRAGSGGADGADSGSDKKYASNCGTPQLFGDTYIATAFGYESQKLVGGDFDLTNIRKNFIDCLIEILRIIVGFKKNSDIIPLEEWIDIFYNFEFQNDYMIIGFRELAKHTLSKALGETRRALNDVTLWDHSFSVSSLYKAALAKVIVENIFPDPKNIKWRLYRIGFDGLSFLRQAHRVTDILGRQQSINEALDEVRNLLEVQYPLGNEIYRDENGSAFLFPSLENDKDGKKLKNAIEKKVFRIFDEKLQGELVPIIIPADEDSRKATELGLLLKSLIGLKVNPKKIQENWENVVGEEICTVCSLRPQGDIKGVKEDYAKDPEKAKKRNICGICLERRGRRAQIWADINGELFKQTIWIDEVADENGRVALLVGKFGLENWLNGEFIQKLLACETNKKYSSFARIRRVWQTTEIFWQEVNQEIISKILGENTKRYEIEIAPATIEGKFHVFELIHQHINIPVVWHHDKKKLITAVRNNRLKEKLDIIKGRNIKILEPGGYGRSKKEIGNFQLVGFETIQTDYAPMISLLSEPNHFMSLIPARQAMQAALFIKNKYEIEMGKVRERLPIYLGIIFFDTHSPLYAALDAAKRMLNFKSESEEWHIVNADDLNQNPNLEVRNIKFENGISWKIPLKMGDGITNDEWYLGDLKTKREGESITVAPSFFDFLYLDTIARRFDVRFDNYNRRPHFLFGQSCSPRPYYLEVLDIIEKVWNLCKNNNEMTKNKLYGIWDLLVTRFQQLNLKIIYDKNADEWKLFEKFCHQVIQKEFNFFPEQDEFELISKAIKKGLFFDCLEIYLQILKEEI